MVFKVGFHSQLCVNYCNWVRGFKPRLHVGSGCGCVSEKKLLVPRTVAGALPESPHRTIPATEQPCQPAVGGGWFVRLSMSSLTTSCTKLRDKMSFEGSVCIYSDYPSLCSKTPLEEREIQLLE